METTGQHRIPARAASAVRLAGVRQVDPGDPSQWLDPATGSASPDGLAPAVARLIADSPSRLPSHIPAARVSANPAAPIEVDGVGVKVCLPEPRTESVSVRPGAMVFGDGTEHRRTVVSSTGSGAQVVSVLLDSAAPPDSRYLVRHPGSTKLACTVDGALAVYDNTDSQVMALSAPWARDAGGRAIPSALELDGDTVIHTVDVRDATYPVVTGVDVVRSASERRPVGMLDVVAARQAALLLGQLALATAGAIGRTPRWTMAAVRSLCNGGMGWSAPEANLLLLRLSYALAASPARRLAFIVPWPRAGRAAEGASQDLPAAPVWC